MTIDFDKIYRTELVYVPGCWKLCGDAHCCSFRRYKARFRLVGGAAEQELPLLPGEYEFMRDRGWLSQFADHEHRVIDYPFGNRSLRIESIVSRRPGGCACDHATRPTICRLYPLMPAFDVRGRLIGTQNFGVYETLEALEGLEKACKITDISFPQLDKFLDIASEIGGDPRALFYVSAYHLAREHLKERLQELKGDKPVSYFTVFEMNLLRKRLLDHQQLSSMLMRLADEFESVYGPGFNLP